MGKAMRAVQTGLIGLVLVALALGVTHLVSCVESTPPSTQKTELSRIESWEYKVIYVAATPGVERLGNGSLSATSIVIDEAQLNDLGKDHWELTSTLSEYETAFPNLSNDLKYVTGIQPNIRPKAVIFFFKRSIGTAFTSGVK
jgi:hypothetical protein